MSNGIQQRFTRILRSVTALSVVLFSMVPTVIASGESANAGCVNSPAGLVAWWTGDGHARDTRGSNNATVINGVTYTSAEVFVGFGFNGVNQYLSVPQSAVLPVRETSDFTIEAWIKHQGDATNEAFNVLAYRNGGQDIQFFVTRTHIGIWGTSAAGMIILTPHNVDAALWNHYAFTRSGNTWKVYVNGSQAGSDASNAVSLLTPTTIQAIGTTGLANTQFAKGVIDEIGIYDRSLNLAEIQSIYNSGTAGKCRQSVSAPVGLISSWAGDGNALDSRSRNNGSLQNGAAYATGNVDQAFSFNGLNQHVEIPDAQSLRPTAGITLEGWFRFNTPSPNAALVSKPFLSGSSNAFVMWIQGGSLWGSSGGGFLSTPFSPATDRWYHIAYTFDAAASLHKLLIDGEVVATKTQAAVLTYDSASVLIGIDKDSGMPVLSLNGLADEVGIYNRALSVGEIQAVCNSGANGKLRPDAVTVPSGLIGWWGGDGDTRDYSAIGNDGTLLANGTYSVGKVGQAFSSAGTLNSGVTIPHNAAYDVTSPTGFSVEFWMKSNGPHIGIVSVVDKSHGFTDVGGWAFAVGSVLDYRLLFNMADTSVGSYVGTASTAVVDDGNYHHIAGTLNAGTLSLYVDGVFQSSNFVGLPANNTRPLLLGYAWGGGTPERFFNGKIDEVSIYNRSLTAAEIQSIYSAGLAGKIKSAMTPANVFTEPRGKTSRVSTFGPGIQLADATVSLPVVLTEGVTQQIPLDGVNLPPMPAGLTPTHLSYDIATSAVWSGTPTVCFNVPSLAGQFTNLRILHLERGSWIDRTQIGGTSPNLCTNGLTDLSPFAIATLIPTAASASISGRTRTAEGRPIRNVSVEISGGSLSAPRFSRTNSFGYYHFDDLEVGQTYIVSVASRKYVFTDPTRVISLNDNVDDEDFISAGR